MRVFPCAAMRLEGQGIQEQLRTAAEADLCGGKAAPCPRQMPSAGCRSARSTSRAGASFLPDNDDPRRIGARERAEEHRAASCPREEFFASFSVMCGGNGGTFGSVQHSRVNDPEQLGAGWDEALRADPTGDPVRGEHRQLFSVVTGSTWVRCAAPFGYACRLLNLVRRSGQKAVKGVRDHSTRVTFVPSSERLAIRPAFVITKAIVGARATLASI